MAHEPTLFVDGTAVTARALENTGASFDTGGNIAGSNSPGIGINLGGGALPDKDTDITGWNWTLTDQDEDARTPQVGQVIGGAGFVDRATPDPDWPSSGGAEGKGTAGINLGVNPDNVEGEPVNDTAITVGATVQVVSLAAGWVATP